ncbi:SEC12P-like 2 protein [Actinidia rufa]|uniref:SEC12P-like 2 protein n=1 Tax=Actinidia rufa TaxID=165716 RepID=A0A7J0H5K6_9ERIC|nr:SEC12P-like 2 protein [Actinidia rufa]
MAKDTTDANCKKYGVPLYGASWVPPTATRSDPKPTPDGEDEPSGDESPPSTPPIYHVVLAGGGGEGRSGIPNALLLVHFDFASNCLSDQPRDRHQVGGNGAGPARPNQPVLERPPNFHRNEPRDPIINVEAPTFDGRLDPKAFTDWIREMDHFFEWYNLSDDRKVRFAKMKLISRAKLFWQSTEQRRQPPVTDWVEMKEILREKYLPQSYQGDMLDKWNNLRQGSKPATEYVAQFEEYLMRCDIREDERMTLSRFRQGLNDDLRKELVLREVDTLDQAYTFVQNYEMVSKPSFGRRFESQNTLRPPATLPPSRPVPNTAPLLKDGKERGILDESPGMKSTFQCYKCQEQLYEPDLENLPKSDEDCEGGDVTLGVVRCALTQAKEDNDWRRNAIFYTYIKCGEKDCKVIIDSGSCINAVSSSTVSRLGLKPVSHPTDSRRRRAEFQVGHYVMVRIRPERYPSGHFDVPTDPFSEPTHEPTIDNPTTSDITPAPLPNSPAPKEHIDAILDEQIISTRDGSVQRFLVRWSGRPASDDTWITSEDLQQIDRDLFEYYQSRPAIHSTESSFLHPGRVGGDNGSRPPITRVYGRRSKKARAPCAAPFAKARRDPCAFVRFAPFTTLVGKLGTGSDLPYRMAVHPGGGGVICSLPKSCRLFEWDAVKGTDIQKLGLKLSDKSLDKLDDVGQQLALNFNNEGSVLALGGEDGKLRVFKWPSMEIMLDEANAYASVKDLDFSPDGKFLVSVGSGGPGRVWDVTSSTPVVALSKENDEIFGFCRFSLSSDKNPVLYITAMRGQSGSILKWDTSSWKRVSSKHIVRDPVSAFNVFSRWKAACNGFGHRIFGFKCTSDCNQAGEEKWYVAPSVSYLESVLERESASPPFAATVRPSAPLPFRCRRLLSVFHVDQTFCGSPSSDFLNMELNRALLLVHNDAALNKFRTDHSNPKDVQIERLGPNEDANLVKGNGNRIPVCTELIYQAGLRFPISPMLKECRGSAACINYGAAEEGAGHTLSSRATRDLHLRNPRQPQTRKVTDNPVNNRQASRKVIDLLAYEPIYRHVIPHKADKLGRIRLPALRIEGRAPQRCNSSSRDFNAELNEDAPLARVLGWEEGITSKEPGGVEPSSSEAPLLDKRKRKQLAGGLEARLGTKHDWHGRKVARHGTAGTFDTSRVAPPKSPRRRGTSLAFLPSSSVNAELWKPDFSTAELGKQVTVADSTKDHDTNLALAQAIMLPKDVANVAEECSKEIRDLLSAEIKKSKNKISSLEKQAKLDSEAAEKAKLEFAVAVQGRDASYAAVTEARGEVASIQEQLDKALGQLKKVSCGPVFERVYNRGINRAGDNYDNQLAELRPAVESVDPPQAYSPLVLPGFNKEALLEETADEVPEKTPEVACELGQEAAEASAAAGDVSHDL